MYIENYIKIADLKDGHLYKIIARNASYGIWIARRQAFAISRIKFGDNFIFEEYHYDCESFATAQPTEELEEAPFGSENIEIKYTKKNGKEYFGYKDEIALLKYLNRHEGSREYLWPKGKG